MGTERPFDRLVTAIDRLCASGQLDDVLIQIGADGQTPKHARFIRLVPFADMERLIGQAKLVVCHAGVGTVSLCRAVGKKPLVIPRRSDLGEAVDEHQVLMARRLASMNVVNLIEDTRDIGGVIKQILALGDTATPPPEVDPARGPAQRIDELCRGLAQKRSWRRRLWDWTDG